MYKFVCLLVAPYNVTIHSSVQYFHDETLEISCTSEGYPDLQYSWSRETGNGNMFPSDTMINSSTIIINNLEINDGGNYTCSVSNKAGSCSVTAAVNVNGKLLYM